MELCVIPTPTANPPAGISNSTDGSEDILFRASYAVVPAMPTAL